MLVFIGWRKYPVNYLVITYRRREGAWLIHSRTQREWRRPDWLLLRPVHGLD